MKKGIIYVRVSSADQIQGTSLDNQKRACLEYAERNQIEVVQIFIEKGESATAANRTEFLKALEFCRDYRGEVHAFIVWKIDRFARNTTDHFAVRAKLTKSGVALHSVTEPITQDHIGKLMETFLAGYAEFENDVRKQRCTSGMQGRLREGIWCWMPPIGYVNSKKRKDRRKTTPDIPDEERFYLIQKGLRLYKTRNYSITALAKESEKWGLKTRTGRPVRKQLWEVILSDKFYTGILIDPWNGEEYRGLHKPMITLEEFEQIQAIKKGFSNGATGKRWIDNPDFALRRFIRCECGHTYTGSWSKGRSRRYANYHCHNRKCVHFGHTIQRDVLEQKFSQFLGEVQPVPEYLELFKQIVSKRYEEHCKSQEQERKQRGREQMRLENQRKELMEMRAGGEISKEEYKELKEAVNAKIASLSDAKNSYENFALEPALSNATRLIGNVADEWTRFPAKRQRLQRAVLTDGIAYSKTNETFGTAILSPIFRLNQIFLTNPSDLVAEVGQNWNQIVEQIKNLSELARDDSIIKNLPT